MLELRGVSKTYDGGRIVAVRDVDLSVRAGETVAIIGPSGSGKTTLINLATGLDRPDSGEVRIDGAAVTSPRQWTRLRRQTIGIVFQAFHLIGTLTARENVEVPLIGVGLGRTARSERARECLERVGLGHRLHHLPEALSGGERQRVAIARALANRPRLLIADEPTGSLDTASSAAIVDLLLDLVGREGMALLTVTHEPVVAERMARVVRLVDARIQDDAIAAPEPAG